MLEATVEPTLGASMRAAPVDTLKATSRAVLEVVAGPPGGK